jgi:hypothetical protein
MKRTTTGARRLLRGPRASLLGLLFVLAWALSLTRERAAIAQGPAPAAGGSAKAAAAPAPIKPKADKPRAAKGKFEPGYDGDANEPPKTKAPNSPEPPKPGPEAQKPEPRKSARQLRKETVPADTTLHTKRVNSLMKLAAGLKQSCATVDADANKTPPATINMLNFCNAFCHDGASIDLCSFTDPVAANAAVLADWSSAWSLIQYAQDVVAAYKPAVSTEAVSTRHTNATKMVSEAASAAGLTGGPVGEVATVALDTLQVGLAALAKVIEDRAKREAIGWFLQSVGNDLCWRDAPPGSPQPATVEQTEQEKKDAAQRALEVTLRRELTAYWFPTLCKLAGSNNDLTQYGAGAKLLEALRSALAKDVRSWPGVAAGLGLGAAFWESSELSSNGNLLECAPGGSLFSKDDRKADCAALTEVRKAGAVFMDQLLVGQSATNALSTLSARLDAVNHKGKGALYSDGFQVAACAAAIPFYFDQYGGWPTGGSDGPGMDRAQQTEAVLVAALAQTPACWTMVGKGVLKSSCEALKTTGRTKPADSPARATPPAAPASSAPSGSTGAPPAPLAGCKDASTLALGADGPVERLSTVLRLSGRLSTGARSVQAQWDKLAKALEVYEEAVQATIKAQATPPAPLVPDAGKDPKSPVDVTTLKDLLEEQARLIQKGPIVRHLQAAVALARAGVDMGGVSIDALTGVLDEKLYPGLSQQTQSKVNDLKGKLVNARLVITEVSGDLGVVEGVVNEDWGAAVAQTLGNLRSRAKVLCPEDDKNCQDKVSRFTGFIVAVISEKDPDRLAQTLDSLADPVGGWRTKGNKKTVTVSLAAFPGFAGGAEWRTGQYGVVRENFRKTYGAAPTLVMPVGLDIALGTGCRWPSPVGFFVSVIDPAAFLQYDVSRQERLPGPKLTTVLSPGLWLRLGFKDSPFSFNPYAVWRPGLRAWDPGVSTPAADAFQVGAAVSVDVTLFSLYSNH